jgi:hypothetical protein
MAKRKDIEATSGEPAASPDGAPEPAQANNEIKSELPTVESQSISPATPAPVIEPITAAEPAIEPIAEAPPTPASDNAASAAPAPAISRHFIFNARHKRNALLAASVAIAAALGAVVGAVASGGFAAPARSDVAGLEETKAMQQSITRLSREITTLKASVEAANKSAHSQFAKISERFDRGLSPETTASIAPAKIAEPIPTPRPAPQRAAALEPPPPARAPVVQDWAIRDAHDGYAYVQGHGEIYQVVAGAPLPGLGPVESVKRQDGRWVVMTPKGVIVSMRDRRYFESF